MTSENQMIPEQDIKDLKTKMNQLEAVYVAQGRTDDWITINEWDKVIGSVAGAGAAIIAITAGVKNVPFKPSRTISPDMADEIKKYAETKGYTETITASDEATIKLFEKRMRATGLRWSEQEFSTSFTSGKTYTVPALEKVEADFDADFDARKTANIKAGKPELDGFTDVEKKIDNFIQQGKKGGNNLLGEVLDRFEVKGQNNLIENTLKKGAGNIVKGTKHFVHRAVVPKSTGGKWGFYVALGTAVIAAVYASLGGEDQSEEKDSVQLTSSSLSKEKREKACAGLGYLLSDDSPLNKGEKEKLLNLQRTSLGTPQGDALMEQLAKIGDKIPSFQPSDENKVNIDGMDIFTILQKNSKGKVSEDSAVESLISSKDRGMV